MLFIYFLGTFCHLLVNYNKQVLPSSCSKCNFKLHRFNLRSGDSFWGGGPPPPPPPKKKKKKIAWSQVLIWKTEACAWNRSRCLAYLSQTSSLFHSFRTAPDCAHTYSERLEQPNNHEPAIRGRLITQALWPFLGLLPISVHNNIIDPEKNNKMKHSFWTAKHIYDIYTKWDTREWNTYIVVMRQVCKTHAYAKNI